LFDVDGTLADTERFGHRVAFNEAFAEAGLEWHWDEALYGRLLSVTGGKERIRYYIEQFREDIDLSPELLDQIRTLHRAKTEKYRALLASGAIPLRPGVQRLLETARSAGLRLGIATTTTPENVTELLRNTLGESSIDWFDVIAAGDVVPAKKPAPDIYLWAMEQLGLKPQECLAVEDSHNGAVSVARAGIQALLVTVNGYTEEEAFPDTALVVDHLGEANRPCRVLQGEMGDERIVTLPLLRRLHAQSRVSQEQS
jgi:HAD superfamily hydrolase (TIGR01509 family)